MKNDEGWGLGHERTGQQQGGSSHALQLHQGWAESPQGLRGYPSPSTSLLPLPLPFPTRCGPPHVLAGPSQVRAYAAVSALLLLLLLRGLTTALSALLSLVARLVAGS